MWIIITVLLFGTVVDLKAQSLLSDHDHERMSQAIYQKNSILLEEKREFLHSIDNSSFCSVQSPETTVINTINSSDFQLNVALKCSEKMSRLFNYYDIFLDIDATYFEPCLNKLKNLSMAEHRTMVDQLLVSNIFFSC